MSLLPTLAALTSLAVAPQDPAPGALDRKDEYRPPVAEASDEGLRAIERFELAPGLSVRLWAAEPLVANPVVFTLDPRGAAWVCESFRLHAGVTDMREHMDWLDEDLAAQTVADRLAMMQRHEGERFAEYGRDHDRLRIVRDTDGDGTADTAIVFADGFDHPADGIGAGVLVREDDVYYTCIPSLWLLRDADGDGVADERRALSTGYGVNISLLGHDMHGLALGLDGRLYFSIGDRGFHVEHEGRVHDFPKTGGVLRCELDGSGLEVFATGLRNPQELAFDDLGNLFTGDNNSDGGDRARFVYVVEGGDSGWRYPYQWITSPNLRGPWNAERMWHPQHDGQTAWIVPPVANIADGPSGLAFNPGTGLPPEYDQHFFLCDFRGDASISGVHAFAVKERGAGFQLVGPRRFLWGSLVTDVEFGYDGGVYVSDWVHGWGMTGKGRLYRLSHRDTDPGPAEEAGRLLRDGLGPRSPLELVDLLGHADRRVRIEAQYALTARGIPAVPAIRDALGKDRPRLQRIHALWALGNLYRTSFLHPGEVIPLLEDPDPEIRAQAARCIGEFPLFDATELVLPLLGDPVPRVRYFAALGAGRSGQPSALLPILDVLERDGATDPWIRNACVVSLARIGKDGESVLLGWWSRSEVAAVRTGILLALRRLESPEVARFLGDPDPRVALEAARAIYDVPIPAAMPSLAALAGEARPDSEPLLRRVLNANHSLGGPEHARAVAALAWRADMPAAIRVEALQRLRAWGAPPPRDPVMGDWRPLSARDDSFLVDTVQALYDHVVGRGELRATPREVQLGLIDLWADWIFPVVEDLLSSLALDDSGDFPPDVRVRALERLVPRGGAAARSTLSAALRAADPRVRGRAIELLAEDDPGVVVPLLTELLLSADTGTEELRSAYRALAVIGTAEAQALLAGEVRRMQAGALPPSVHLDLVLAAERIAAGPATAALAAWRAELPADDDLGDRVIALHGGDADAGRAIFFERSEVSCLKCHRMGDVGGSEAGPDLTDVGARKERRYLLESILDPNREIVPEYRNVVVWFEDDTHLSGRLLEETEELLRLEVKTADGSAVETVEIERSGVEDLQVDVSSMPANFAELLSLEELRDLVEFLSSLQG